MKIVLQGIIAELEVDLDKSQDQFVKEMEKKGLMLTYYPEMDSKKDKGGSLGKFSVALKEEIKLKI
jgi:hypothetical protein